jgi:hypothetical protein
MSQHALKYITDRRKYFNISKIEDHCGITRTALLNAINRKQTTFGQSDLLVPFLNKYFEGWNSQK